LQIMEYEVLRIPLRRRGPQNNERRSYLRYPVQVGMEYRLKSRGESARVGTGRTVNLSSGGLLVETDIPLAEALPIQLSLAWPALLAGGKRLLLKIRGKTVWVKGKHAAVRILHHDFHVRAGAVSANPTIGNREEPPA
jgi:hypothetical protein